ncbi:MAG: cupin domain-containing protein [Achromobacter sp.]|uniref:cupin domain-containing protein n=1 Tax=Achromobacter sp. TaxID=134375 RepID=UPI003CFE8F78
MALVHANPLDVIDLLPPRESTAVDAAVSLSLLRTVNVQLIRLVLPAQHRMPSHRVPGELTLQCLSGHVDIETPARTCTLAAGQLVMLPPDEPHCLYARAPAVVLLTLLHPVPGIWRPRAAADA